MMGRLAARQQAESTPSGLADALGDLPVSIEPDGNGGWNVTLTNDVDAASLPIEIPDNLGPVAIDLGGHDLVGANGQDARSPDESGSDGMPAIRIVPGVGDGEPTVLTVITTGGDATVKGGDGGVGNPGGKGAAAIAVADGARDGVLVNIGAGVTVQGGNGGTSDNGGSGAGGPGVAGNVGTNDGTIIGGNGGEAPPDDVGKPDYSLQAGEYFKMTLAAMGYDVPTNGTPYNVVAKGLPSGLQLKSNAAVTKKVKSGKTTKTVVVKQAKCEWWIEGVPTAALDFYTNPPYLVITANGTTVTEPLPVEVLAQKVTELDDLALGTSLNEQFYLPGVTNGWTVTGLPTGLKYTPKLVTTKKKVGKKNVVTTNALPYSVYGKTTKAGLFTITAKKKKGSFYETMKYRVLVTPKAVDTAMFGDSFTNLTTMAYVPFAWDLTADVYAVAGKFTKVTGLPPGVTLLGQIIVGMPTKAGTYVVTFTKSVKNGKTTVAKTAQILWKVIANDAELSLGFNDRGGVVESGTVGLKYGELLSFSVTEGAKVTASGLPAGITLAKLDGGALGERALPEGCVAYAFTGFTTKAGTYLVTVTATLNGKTVRQRLALKVDGLPAWAKGTFNGVVTCPSGIAATSPGSGEELVAGYTTNGLATITVSTVGKISGKFQENGTNWTFSAASYTAMNSGTQDACLYQEYICSNVVAKYAYKVKSGKTTVTKYVTRTFQFAVSQVPVVPDVSAVPARGVATMTEEGGSTIEAWQNIWGRAEYKALGKKLFTTKSGKKTLAYRTFTISGSDGEGVGDALPVESSLSLKITTAGAVTATMTFDTGKTKKDPKTRKTVKVYYKPACSTVVIPTSAADADSFTGDVHLYFAPSPANNFPGWSGIVGL